MSEIYYRFEVVFLKDVLDFLKTLDKKSRVKVLENIRIARFKNDPRLFKKVDKDIWEFRTRYGNKQIRLLSFWDNEIKSHVICTNGFVKKTKKLPLKELRKAKELRFSYFDKKQKK